MVAQAPRRSVAPLPRSFTQHHGEIRGKHVGDRLPRLAIGAAELRKSAPGRNRLRDRLFGTAVAEAGLDVYGRPAAGVPTVTGSMRMTRVLGTALVMIGCAWSADAGAAPLPVTTPTRAAVQAAQTPPPASNEFVGDDTCTTCHTQTLKGTKHGVVADPR